MRKPVILLVEDDYRSYQALSVELTELGFTALPWIRNLTEFTELMKAREARFDLAIVDVQLGPSGNRDGTEIARRLRDRLPVILHTNYNGRYLSDLTASSAHLTELIKPVHPNAWLARIVSMLKLFYPTEYLNNLIMPNHNYTSNQLIKRMETTFVLPAADGVGEIRVHLGEVSRICTSTQRKGMLTFDTDRGAFEVRGTLDKVIENYLDPAVCRVHRSCIINWTRVTGVNKRELTVAREGGYPPLVVSVGKNYWPAVKQRLDAERF